VNRLDFYVVCLAASKDVLNLVHFSLDMHEDLHLLSGGKSVHPSCYWNVWVHTFIALWMDCVLWSLTLWEEVIFTFMIYH